MSLFLVSRLSHRLREGRPPEGPAVGVSVTVDTVQGLLASGSGQAAPELLPLGFDTVLVEESHYVRPTLGLWKYILHTQVEWLRQHCSSYERRVCSLLVVSASVFYTRASCSCVPTWAAESLLLTIPWQCLVLLFCILKHLHAFCPRLILFIPA